MWADKFIRLSGSSQVPFAPGLRFRGGTGAPALYYTESMRSPSPPGEDLEPDAVSGAYSIYRRHTMLEDTEVEPQYIYNTTTSDVR